ncbi:hypothetical protein [Apilactobacillus kunkeei]|uniref:hypothetical protein n=1 Tax=Apilactobacillus kunkeei TaxID=148814 RepID=UPI001127F05E|nr:hypothetical protein [Apilactobacillus kunkeei]TPR53190.1 hypothetical protein DY036_07115 [Apilactobacillus kunkeei]
MEFIGTIFSYVFIGSIIAFFVVRSKNKKGNIKNYKRDKTLIFFTMVVSFILTGIIGIAVNDSNDSQTHHTNHSSTKTVKKENKSFDYSKYKDFNSEFPKSLNSYNENELMTKDVKFTGKVYGLSASSLGYQIILKDTNNHLAYLTSDGKQSGKITSFDSLTVYGSTNGTSKISKNDFNRFDNQIKDNDLGKETILLEPDKIIVHHDTNIN